MRIIPCWPNEFRILSLQSQCNSALFLIDVIRSQTLLVIGAAEAKWLAWCLA